MFEAMMLRFQEDTARHLFRMQILAPDGTPIETPEQLAALQAQFAAQQQFQTPPPSQMPQPDETHWQPNQQPAEQEAFLPPGSWTGQRLPQTAPRNGGQPQAASAPAAPPAIPTRAPHTTIDALEREFERNKQRDLAAAHAAGGSASASSTPARSGPEPGRNDPCFCGSGKKYKKCHGANA